MASYEIGTMIGVHAALLLVVVIAVLVVAGAKIPELAKRPRRSELKRQAEERAGQRSELEDAND